jgi:hypothetical protein
MEYAMKWSDRVNWYDIPERMHAGVIRYVERGIPPGHFLEAIFANDLMEVVARGDEENLKRIHWYGKLLWNQCPSDCFGNPELVRQWIKRGGIMGNDKHEPLPVHEWSRWADQDYR